VLAGSMSGTAGESANEVVAVLFCYAACAEVVAVVECNRAACQMRARVARETQQQPYGEAPEFDSEVPACVRAVMRA